MTSMLPAIPAALGNLKDVFRSAELSVQALPNPLGLPSAKSAIVLMVDGLGALNLAAAQHSAPFLTNAKSIDGYYSGFPSTTVVSIASFATGAPSGEHGLFGYRIYDRGRSESVNLLSGLDKYTVLDYLKSKSISETSSLEVHVVTLAEYEDSGMTRATMNLARHHFANSIAERLEIAVALSEVDNRLIYVYVPELDQSAHRFGAASDNWRTLLGELDAAVSKCVSSIRKGVGLLLTADHGIVDVDKSRHIYLDLIDELKDQLLDVAGDPRVAFLYLKNSLRAEAIRHAVQDYCFDRALVQTPSQLVDAGLWQQQLLDEVDLMPDLVLIATADVAFYHRDFAKANSLKMVGQHGALSQAEISIPLLAFGAF